MTSFVHHRLDIYDVDLYLVTSKSEWKALRQTTLPDMPKFDVDHQAACMTLASDDDDLKMIFYFRNTDINTVAHEAYHGAGLILDHITQEYDGSSEAAAWLVGWLSEWIWSHTERAI